MIIVPREWIARMGQHTVAVQVAKEYKEKFNPSSSWRLLASRTGTAGLISIEEDYESWADYEIKWAERQAMPEFQTWVKKWGDATFDGTFVNNIFEVIE